MPRGVGKTTLMATPPTRGWTLWAILDQLEAGGYPAYAGMDP